MKINLFFSTLTGIILLLLSCSAFSQYQGKTEAENAILSKEIIVGPITKHSSTEALMDIYDDGEHDEHLIAATSDIAKLVQLHKFNTA